MFQVDDQQLQISGLDGFLTIKTNSGKTIIIQEQPMLVFEEFYKKWSMAMQLGGKDDFLNAYTFNQPFRSLIVDCLQLVGLEDVGQLTLSQIEALLLSHKEGAGLLFQLHQTFPKLQVQAPESKVWMISFKTVLMLTTLMLLEYIHTRSWMEKLPAQLGRYLVSCVSWLSNRMPNLLTIQKQLKVYVQPNGQTELRILK